jgi:ADP-ribose pyrophosphatase YjhB (NUDIX family)
MSSSEVPQTEPIDTEVQIARWADQLRAIARTGLHYVESEYDRERYRRIEEIAAEMASSATGAEPAQLIAAWSADVGYVTPKVGLVAAVHDERGRVLLLRRPDSGLWSLPAGFAEVGESPARGIAREVREETGLVVVPRRLLGIYDNWANGSTNPHQIYAVAFLCEGTGGALELTPEALDLRYFGSDDLPEITISHRRAIRDALAAWPELRPESWFDS